MFSRGQTRPDNQSRFREIWLPGRVAACVSIGTSRRPYRGAGVTYPLRLRMSTRFRGPTRYQTKI